MDFDKTLLLGRIYFKKGMLKSNMCEETTKKRLLFNQKQQSHFLGYFFFFFYILLLWCSILFCSIKITTDVSKFVGWCFFLWQCVLSFFRLSFIMRNSSNLICWKESYWSRMYVAHTISLCINMHLSDERFAVSSLGYITFSRQVGRVYLIIISRRGAFTC